MTIRDISTLIDFNTLYVTIKEIKGTTEGGKILYKCYDCADIYDIGCWLSDNDNKPILSICIGECDQLIIVV